MIVRDIAGKSVDWFEPGEAIPRVAMLYLHDADAMPLTMDPVALKALFGIPVPCVGPIAGKCWWSAKICREFEPAMSSEEFVVRHIVPAIAERWPTVPIALAGRGMGGQGALRIAFKYPDLFACVVAIDAAIDHFELYGEGGTLDDMYPSREHCRQDGAGLHIHPVRQPKRIWFACSKASRWHRGNDRLHEKLRALGVGHEFEERECPSAELIEQLQELSKRVGLL